jgi:diaminopimelate epimerase
LRAAFLKYEGLGNDFIVVDAADEQAVTAARAVELCDRHRGVGADGVLLVLPPRGAEGAAARMRVINADGSTPEMCGNGVRCVALHLVRARGLGEGPVGVETDAGLRVCAVDSLAADAASAMVTVDMGVVRVLGERSLAELGEPGLDALCTLADAGNPHAVLFSGSPGSRSFTRADVDRIGPRLATHPAFPHGTNVEFARATGTPADASIDLVVWERGVGVTLACGTGACATVAVACARGLATRGKAVPVRLPGGRLDVTIDADGRATMRGPARYVFSGALL